MTHKLSEVTKIIKNNEKLQVSIGDLKVDLATEPNEEMQTMQELAHRVIKQLPRTS